VSVKTLGGRCGHQAIKPSSGPPPVSLQVPRRLGERQPKRPQLANDSALLAYHVLLAVFLIAGCSRLSVGSACVRWLALGDRWSREVMCQVMQRPIGIGIIGG